VTFKGKIYLITFLSLVFLVVLNEYNLSLIGGKFPYKDGLITTADEYSYFAPADHFIKYFRWAESPEGKLAFMRTPGYGVIYLFAKLIGGSHAFLILKLFQVALFGGSILMLSKILQFLHVRENIILIMTAFYGMMPCFSGFVYYTLSESVIPFFILWFIFSLLKQFKEQRFCWGTVFSITALVMIRPQLVVFPVLMLLFVLFTRRWKIALSLVFGFIPLLVWQIRTISIEGTFTNFHPIYSVSNNSLYRPPHEAMTDLFRIWDHRGDVFHGNMALLSRDTLASTRQEVLKTIPAKFHTSVEPVLMKFQEFRSMQHEDYSGKAITDFLPGEKQLVKEIKQTRRKLIRNFPFDHYLRTPLMSAKKLVGTSMMNLFVFQEKCRNNVLVIVMKFISFGLIVAGILAMLIVILFHTNEVIRITALSVLLSLTYLCFIQRFNEERYLTPYLSLLMVFVAIVIQRYLPYRK
jgi:ABC-type multidrug transport system fused ATPase/permease subunit